MSTFVAQKNVLVARPPDPTRHVFFHRGMVLGEDDFNQEFAYHAGHLQWLARDLIGYGTVAGLRVLAELDETGKPRLVVEPGVALSPRGQLIRVPTRQCAYLNDWLALDKTKERIAKDFTARAVLPVYVVLCYRDCATEKVPLPGEPCRSEDDLLVDSRLADDFELRLSFDPPGQREEDALRDVVQWFEQITISETEASIDLVTFLQELRSAAHTLTSPPLAGAGPLPDYLFGSPPASLLINARDVCDYLRAAFRLWVTELRPLYRPEWFTSQGACSGPTAKPETPPEECLLLAEVRLPVTVLPGVGAREISDPNKIEIHEEQRPYLLHLRMLQEWLLCGKQGGFGAPAPPSPPTLAGDATGPLGATVVEGLRGRPIALTAPTAGQVLRFNTGTGQWEPFTLPISAPQRQPGISTIAEQAFGLAPTAGAALEYSRADHTHGTPLDPIPAHVAGVNAHRFHEVRGDVTNILDNTQVSRLQGYPLALVPATTTPPIPPAPVVPAEGQVLTFRGGAWRSEAAPSVTNVVRRPPGLPEYFIVAAGRIRCNNPPTPNPFKVYNGLRVLNVSNGEVLMTFDKMKMPGQEFQYVIKALPELNEISPIPGAAFVYFGDFFAAVPDPINTGQQVTAFSLRFRNLQTAPVDLSRMVLMIEVSQFF